MNSFSSPLNLKQLCLIAVCLLLSATSAQSQSAHYFQRGDAAPGATGQIQLMAREGSQNAAQSVQVIGPEGSTWSYWDGEQFVESGTTSTELKMAVGGVYQLKLSGIPDRPNVDLFPTIELINRLYPPEGLTEKFSVIVELPMPDLQQAIEGKFVTRVVYLEDPNTAMPYRQTASEQPYFDVPTEDDVLQVAMRLGRPMAIARIGSRIPDVALPSK